MDLGKEQSLVEAHSAGETSGALARPEVSRPHVRGKFIFVGDEKLYLRGTTYGPFRPTEDGCEYHNPDRVQRDFAAMAQAGFNTVRVYTVPPRWLLDAAAKFGLYVLVGTPWEQHITFLDIATRRKSITNRVRSAVRELKEHPALLGIAVGNEIPAPIVRWYGRRRIERFIKLLYLTVKREDEHAMVTYINYPTTEYLQLPFLDFNCFNVYLEEQHKLRKYVARLQNLTGERPLVFGEIGLDSRRNGVDEQAESLRWQVSSVFAGGAAGAFVFAWTDEWFRGGSDINDWDFGLVDRSEQPKPAFTTVSEVMRNAPFDANRAWPRISVIICTYNGSRTIAETCRYLMRLDYPNAEIIVVNDGSTDATTEVLDEFVRKQSTIEFRLLQVPNGGLSRARNIGMREATGEIVAYIDDDAYPDQHWLQYLAHSFMTTSHAGIGGPNLPVLSDNYAAYCVAHSPGGPNHVLIDDDLAEHIPGCNMAYRRAALIEVNGFDEQFRIAGDDVDLCWRLQEAGQTLGFNPAAMVWHHRRDSIRGYLKQQHNYGRAEAMLAAKWPEKYNQFGHIAWQGRIYGAGQTLPLIFTPWRIYYGVWGSGLFQSLYRRSPDMLRSMPMMPEWYLIAGAFAVILMPALYFKPAISLIAIVAIAIGLPLLQGLTYGWQAELRVVKPKPVRIALRAAMALLHVLQPLVRLKGRFQQGLRPWRRPMCGWRWPILGAMEMNQWRENWVDVNVVLRHLEAEVYALGGFPRCGGPFDRWDFSVRGGMFGSIRLIMAIEEHGGGKQQIRIRMWSYIGPAAKLLFTAAGCIGVVALLFNTWVPAAVAGVIGILAFVRVMTDSGYAWSVLSRSIEKLEEQSDANSPSTAMTRTSPMADATHLSP